MADSDELHGTTTTVSEAERERLGVPVFVKPARSGSSIGVSRVNDWSCLDDTCAHER